MTRKRAHSFAQGPHPNPFIYSSRGVKGATIMHCCLGMRAAIYCVVLSLSACATGAAEDLRVIPITPVSARVASYQLPYSVDVEFSEIENNRYGAPFAFARLDQKNIQESLSDFIRERDSFRLVKRIPGNLADLTLQSSLVLSYGDRVTSLEYTVALDVKLLDRENVCLAVYRESAETTVNITLSPFEAEDFYWKEKWLNPVNKVVNLAFQKIVERIEQDLVQDKVRLPASPVSRQRRTQVVGVLVKTLREETRTHYRMEAALDLADQKAVLGPSDVEKILVDVVGREEETDVLQAATGSLWKIDSKSTIDVLTKNLLEGNEVSRSKAAVALGTIGAGARDAIPVLIAVFPEARAVDSSGHEAFLPAVCRGFIKGACGDSVHVTLERSQLIAIQDVDYAGVPQDIKAIPPHFRGDFIFYAGAWALGEITGKHLGTDRGRWRRWWESKGEGGAPSSDVSSGAGEKPQEDGSMEGTIEEASRLNERAVELYGRGQYDAAEPLFAKALRIREKALGPKHQDIAQTLNSLAMLHDAKGDSTRAAEFYRKACGRGFAPACSKKPPAAQADAASVHVDATASPPKPEASEKREPTAGSVTLGFEYSSLGGSNGVTRNNGYAAALHAFLAGFGPGHPIAMDLDAVLGGGSGFQYDLDLLLGPGWWFNHTVAAAAIGGVGIDGITGGTLPFALKAPVRLLLSLNLGAAVRVEARAGVNWLFATSDRRKSGSEAVHSFADEMLVGGRIFIGRRPATNAKDGPAQLALGFNYLETLGSRTLLFMVGLGGALDPRFE